MAVLVDCVAMSAHNATNPVAADIDDGRDSLSTLLKASADPVRLDILRVLSQESFGVQELCKIFEMRQPALSHHLKVLATAGLVASRREGNSLFYRRHHQALQPAWQAFLNGLFGVVDKLALRTEVSARVADVHADRAASSLRFFEANLEQFREQQEQIAIYQQYAEPMRELLDSAELPSSALALEIGPGEGEFLAELAPRFDRVIGLDVSEAMLASATRFVDQAGLSNVELQLGDTSNALGLAIKADCIVANMVLHHTASPADIFHEIAALLAPGGSFFLTELCHHDQAWAREACGDVWLGFDPIDISQWAIACGLTETRQVYFAQRNGFSVQLRQFTHHGAPAEAGHDRL